MNKIVKKSNKGITLVALVVTIIVILILAGISIGMINGGTGIIEQANKAAKQAEASGGIEELHIKYVEALGKDKYGDISEDEFLDYLEEHGIKTKEENGLKYAEVD